MKPGFHCPTLVPVAGRAGQDGRVLRAGLTGGIGSGKSEVSRRLAALGAAVIDADVAARAVVAPGTPGLARVAEVFGVGVLGPDGALDRDRLGLIVFRDPDARARLNAIVHPLVGDWMRAADRAAADAARGDLVIVHDVPLLAENRRAADFDLVIVVDVPPELQLERLVRQRGMTPGQAQARMDAQASREQRLALADLVIDNSGSLADLDCRVTQVWADLRHRRCLGPVAEQHLGHAYRLGAAFPLECHGKGPLPPAGNVVHRGAADLGADPAADRNRRGEAHLAQAVVDRDRRVSHLEHLLHQQGREREGEEAVRDRAAEGPGRRPLRVDVDPLVIAGRVGEQVDLRLRHLMPGAGA